MSASYQHKKVANGMKGSRQAVIYSWEKETLAPRDKVTASAIAGGISGSVGGILRKSSSQYMLAFAVRIMASSCKFALAKRGMKPIVSSVTQDTNT